MLTNKFGKLFSNLLAYFYLILFLLNCNIYVIINKLKAIIIKYMYKN